MEPRINGPISSGSVFYLSESEIPPLAASAIAGDATSAFRLYQHFAFSMIKPEVALKWLMIASELNHPVAQHNYAFHFYTNGDFTSAQYWARRALNNGNSAASDLLSEIDAKKIK